MASGGKPIPIVDEEESEEETVLSEEGEGKRLKTQTKKGMEQFLTFLKKYSSQEQKAWTMIEEILVDIDENIDQKNFKDLRKIKAELQKFKRTYFDCANDFLSFLKRTNTRESNEEFSIQEPRFRKRSDIIDQLMNRIEDALLDAADTISRASGSEGSRSQSRSSVSEMSKSRVLLRQKAEAEKAKLAFVRQQVDLQTEKSKIEGQIQILNQTCSAAIADAEAKVFEREESETKSERNSILDELPKDRGQRVADYVESVSRDQESSVRSHVNPKIVQPIPSSYNFDVPLTRPKEDSVETVTKFLLRKEVLLSRFSNFNDEPEAYNAWKLNFTSIIKDLQISEFEELQLLVRWLGPESSKHAADIQQANAGNPGRGLRQIWARLDERYGAIELIDDSLKSKLAAFPQLMIKDPKELYKLSDLLTQVDGVKKNPKYSAALSYYDTSLGIAPIVSKLPYQWREKWINKASEYKERHSVPYPPFTYFVKFIQDLCRVRNDPGFQFSEPTKKETKTKNTGQIRSRKTDVKPSKSTGQRKSCFLEHRVESNHNIKDCRKFRTLPIGSRKKLLKENGICFRCCDSKEHLARDCNVKLKCDMCQSDRHCGALHVNSSQGGEDKENSHGGENSISSFTTNCTQVCSPAFSGKSCAKIILVNIFPVGREDLKKRAYVILDDQSSRTLAKSSFFDKFGIKGQEISYTLSSCSGSAMVSGRQAFDFVVSSIQSGEQIYLPSIIECDDIPVSYEEIPTPAVVKPYKHLSDLESEIPPIDDKAEVILIGRDVPSAHHVLEQKIDKPNLPFAQRLPLGWAVIGECCLGRVHRPQHVVVNKTQILPSGRGTHFTPCSSNLRISTYQDDTDIQCSCENGIQLSQIFERTKDDNIPGMSIEDREFLEIMKEKCHKDEKGHWSAPLPFKLNRNRLPNNREQALKRTYSLLKTFKRDPVKMNLAIKFMENVFDNGFAEEAPEVQEGEECWYLPIFPVFHPKKPNKIRMVFDSSAIYQGHSLNSSLLQGPDLTNNLLGVLLRFRKERVAITGDIEQMFHMFHIDEEHRNFVRFIWFRDNDPTKSLQDYRMCVHLFGNSPSPAVATYCLHKCVEEPCDSDVKYYVTRNFYVDDGLSSYDTDNEALDILLRTQEILRDRGKIRFHKFASNSQIVMDALPPEDRAKDLSDVHLDLHTTPAQSSLGLIWNLSLDAFIFSTDLKDVPETKRGVLSCLHSLYDPIGFLSPVILAGKFIFRDITQLQLGWDDPLPRDIILRWRSWRSSLHHLCDVKIPRRYVAVSMKNAEKIELHTFADASEKAISAVTYIKVTNTGETYIGFVTGKSKLAPHHGHTVPRLELCAALLATEIASFVERQLDTQIHDMQFYSDSRVVLGYLYNKTRRFHTYVSNRVQRILTNSKSEQWTFVKSDQNPADIGTRSVSANELATSVWLTGPKIILDHNQQDYSKYPLLDPDNDCEIRRTVTVVKTSVLHGLNSNVFTRFSTWDSLIRGLSFMRSVIRQKINLEKLSQTKLYQSMEKIVIKSVQFEAYGQDIERLKEHKPVTKGSPLQKLDPYLDNEGLLRVGGRILTGDVLAGSNGPIIVPKKSHVARLLIKHHHQKCKHQGRHLTEGAVRSAGYWVMGAKRLISSLLNSCVICRKLRRKLETQKMGNIPDFRCKPSPPFTYVGVDTFGPWEVTARKTRGGVANAKRWAILFTCLTSRAVHIELVDEMTSSAFINSLRRFVAMRGKVTEFYSDRGTNFVGSTDALNINAINIESPTLKKYMVENGSTWIFNPPHASHMGGIWERIIGTARRILNAIIMESKKPLTHDVLNTFMYEVCAIINSRPLANVSVDPTQPSVLSPSVLLTQKTEVDYGPFQAVDVKDMYRSSWKHTQLLANQFWKRWQQEYLYSLQTRQKWTYSKEDIKVDDVVLLKDSDTVRYEWPMAVVQRTFPSKDGHVRKVELRTVRNGTCITYVRPITEIVHLFTP